MGSLVEHLDPGTGDFPHAMERLPSLTVRENIQFIDKPY